MDNKLRVRQQKYMHVGTDELTESIKHCFTTGKQWSLQLAIYKNHFTRVIFVTIVHVCNKMVELRRYQRLRCVHEDSEVKTDQHAPTIYHSQAIQCKKLSCQSLARVVTTQYSKLRFVVAWTTCEQLQPLFIQWFRSVGSNI